MSVILDTKSQVEKVLKYCGKGLSSNEIAYRIMVDNMRWSFSRINGFEGCKYCWFQTYIKQRKDSQQNVFAEYGLLVHEIMEAFYRDELSIMELEDKFHEGFLKLGDFPPNKFVNLRDTYYDGGIKYFQDPDVAENYDIVAVEKEIKTNIGGYEFIGYIDLLIKHKVSGKYVILDHKSKAKFENKEELKKYTRQLYLYAKAVYEEYSEYPSQLIFNRFRKQEVDRIKYDMKAYEEAQQWAVDVIERIKETTEFPVTDDGGENFFGNFLCNFRQDESHIFGRNYTLDELIEETYE